MSSQAFSDSASRSPLPTNISTSPNSSTDLPQLTYQQLVCYCRDLTYDLEDSEELANHQSAIIEQLQSTLHHASAELTEAHHDLTIRDHLLTICTDNINQLGWILAQKDRILAQIGRLIADKDQLIANVSHGITQLETQSQPPRPQPRRARYQEQQIPFAPSLLPSSYLDTTSGLPNSITPKKRTRAITYSAPIEAPSASERNGRPCHRAKRACNRPEEHQSQFDESSASSTRAVLGVGDTAGECLEELETAVRGCSLEEGGRGVE
jgi:hypothetical protein